VIDIYWGQNLKMIQSFSFVRLCEEVLLNMRWLRDAYVPWCVLNVELLRLCTVRRASAGHPWAGSRDQGDNAADNPGGEAADERRLQWAGASLHPAINYVIDEAPATAESTAGNSVTEIRRVLTILSSSARLHSTRLAGQVWRTKVRLVSTILLLLLLFVVVSK